MGLVEELSRKFKEWNQCRIESVRKSNHAIARAKRLLIAKEKMTPVSPDNPRTRRQVLIREVLLPFISTFSGVLLAAFIAMWQSAREETNNLKKLLFTMDEDCISAFTFTRNHLTELEVEEGVQKENLTVYDFKIVPLPVVVLGAFREQPALLSKMQLVSLRTILDKLPLLAGGVDEYNRIIEHERRLLDTARRLNQEERSQLEIKPDPEIPPRAFNLLSNIDISLFEVCFFVQNEYLLLSGKISEKEFQKRVENDEKSLNLEK